MGMQRPSWRTSPRFLRFLIVGGVNTAFAYSVYWLLLAFGAHYAIAALLSTILGVCFNFVTTGRMVFDHALSTRVALRFAAVYVVVYLVNVSLIGALQAVSIKASLGGLLTLLPMALLSFVLLRRFVFGIAHAAD
jgi:putative flippase GtrA